MKRIFMVFVAALLATVVLSQDIRKMKVTELAAYIHQCDHPLIVNFWATFCVPCVKEIPGFQQLAEKYKDKGMELLLVSVDLPDYYPARIASFAKGKNFTARIAWLNETNADYFCPKIDKKWSGGIPATLLVNNRTGYRRFFERELNARELEEHITRMLQ